MSSVEINNIPIPKVNSIDFDYIHEGDYFTTLGGSKKGVVIGTRRSWAIETHPLPETTVQALLTNIGSDSQVTFWVDDFGTGAAINVIITDIQTSRNVETMYFENGSFEPTGRILSFTVEEAEVST